MFIMQILFLQPNIAIISAFLVLISLPISLTFSHLLVYYFLSSLLIFSFHINFFSPLLLLFLLFLFFHFLHFYICSFFLFFLFYFFFIFIFILFYFILFFIFIFHFCIRFHFRFQSYWISAYLTECDSIHEQRIRWEVFSKSH